MTWEKVRVGAVAWSKSLLELELELELEQATMVARTFLILMTVMESATKVVRWLGVNMVMILRHLYLHLQRQC
jgi:hypothetical protein